MKFSALDAGGRDSGCLVAPERFAAVAVAGLAPGLLARLLGAGTSASDWQLLQRAGTLQADSSGPVPFEQPLPGWSEFAFPDGCARLRSGSGGSASFDDQARHEPARLLPRPLLILLAQQWARHGCVPLHAALVVLDGRGLLVLGGQGAGKSTLATAVQGSGGQVVSDDWLLFGRSGAEFVGERLRSFLSLRPGPVGARLLAASRLAWRPARGGRLLHLIDERAALFPASARIDQVWLLQQPVGDRPASTRLMPARAADTVAACVQHSMPLLFTRSFDHERTRLLQLFEALAAAVPVLQVRAGLDLVEHPAGVLPALLARAAA